MADIAHLVPHQASMPIIRELCKRLDWPLDACVTTYPELGNTSGSSIPVALARARSRFRPGDVVAMPAVGAGMAYATALYRWSGHER
jgi:3-oxoacyl-[acyl-carrier-protein] synthase-3